MRANAGFDCLPITPSPRNAAACSSGATLERTTHRVVEPATAAEPMVPVLSSRTLHRGGTRDPTENLSRIGRVSLLLNSRRLLTPCLDRAASQQQKLHPCDRHNQQLSSRQAAQHAQGGSHPNGGGRRKAIDGIRHRARIVGGAGWQVSSDRPSITTDRRYDATYKPRQR